MKYGINAEFDEPVVENYAGTNELEAEMIEGNSASPPERAIMASPINNTKSKVGVGNSRSGEVGGCKKPPFKSQRERVNPECGLNGKSQGINLKTGEGYAFPKSLIKPQIKPQSLREGGYQGKGIQSPPMPTTSPNKTKSKIINAKAESDAVVFSIQFYGKTIGEVGLMDQDLSELDWQKFKSYLFQNLLSMNHQENICVSYSDDEGDKLPIESEEEYREALKVAKKKSEAHGKLVLDITRQGGLPTVLSLMSSGIKRVSNSPPKEGGISFFKATASPPKESSSLGFGERVGGRMDRKLLPTFMSSERGDGVGRGARSRMLREERDNLDQPPQWFTAYMAKFREEMSQQVAAKVTEMLRENYGALTTPSSSSSPPQLTEAQVDDLQFKFSQCSLMSPATFGQPQVDLPTQEAPEAPEPSQQPSLPKPKTGYRNMDERIAQMKVELGLPSAKRNTNRKDLEGERKSDSKDLENERKSDSKDLQNERKSDRKVLPYERKFDSSKLDSRNIERMISQINVNLGRPERNTENRDPEKIVPQIMAEATQLDAERNSKKKGRSEEKPDGNVKSCGDNKRNKKWRVEAVAKPKSAVKFEKLCEKSDANDSGSKRKKSTIARDVERLSNRKQRLEERLAQLTEDYSKFHEKLEEKHLKKKEKLNERFHKQQEKLEKKKQNPKHPEDIDKTNRTQEKVLAKMEGLRKKQSCSAEELNKLRKMVDKQHRVISAEQRQQKRNERRAGNWKAGKAKRVSIDNKAYPVDACLLHAALQKLEALAEDSPSEGSSAITQGFDARYVRDLTFPDGSEVAPGAEFDKTWRVANSGILPWNDKTTLNKWSQVRFRGSPAGWKLKPACKKVLCPSLQPGEQGDISITFTAPNEPGWYATHWRFCQRGRVFGNQMWCAVHVVNSPNNDNILGNIPVEDEEDVEKALPENILQPTVAVTVLQDMPETGEDDDDDDDDDDAADDNDDDDGLKIATTTEGATALPELGTTESIISEPEDYQVGIVDDYFDAEDPYVTQPIVQATRFELAACVPAETGTSPCGRGPGECWRDLGDPWSLGLLLDGVEKLTLSDGGDRAEPNLDNEPPNLDLIEISFEEDAELVESGISTPELLEAPVTTMAVVPLKEMAKESVDCLRETMIVRGDMCVEEERLDSTESFEKLERPEVCHVELQSDSSGSVSELDSEDQAILNESDTDNSNSDFEYYVVRLPECFDVTRTHKDNVEITMKTVNSKEDILERPDSPDFLTADEDERTTAVACNSPHRLSESPRSISESSSKMSNNSCQLSESLRRITESSRQVNESLRQLSETQRQLTEAQRQLAESRLMDEESPSSQDADVQFLESLCRPHPFTEPQASEEDNTASPASHSTRIAARFDKMQKSYPSKNKLLVALPDTKAFMEIPTDAIKLNLAYARGDALVGGSSAAEEEESASTGAQQEGGNSSSSAAWNSGAQDLTGVVCEQPVSAQTQQPEKEASGEGKTASEGTGTVKSEGSVKEGGEVLQQGGGGNNREEALPDELVSIIPEDLVRGVWNTARTFITRINQEMLSPSATSAGRVYGSGESVVGESQSSPSSNNNNVVVIGGEQQQQQQQQQPQQQQGEVNPQSQSTPTTPQVGDVRRSNGDNGDEAQISRSLQQLTDMGFTNVEVNRRLLTKYNNDVACAVADLIILINQ